MELTKIFLLLLGILVVFFLSECCMSKEQFENSKLALKRTNYPPPALSPGTAEVTATIISTIKNNSKTVGIFKIDTVHTYGPSTPPIGVGSKLNIEFSNNLLKDNENKISPIFKNDTQNKLLLRSIRTVMNREDINLWEIISIK